MNYYEARQRSDDKKWAYTGMNDGRIWTEPCCCGGGLDPEKYHAHDTAEEAEHCQYDYEMANAHFDRTLSDEKRKCEVCGEWTQGLVTWGRGQMRSAVLCDSHRNPGSLRQVYPFHAGMSEVSSF